MIDTFDFQKCFSFTFGSKYIKKHFTNAKMLKIFKDQIGFVSESLFYSFQCQKYVLIPMVLLSYSVVSLSKSTSMNSDFLDVYLEGIFKKSFFCRLLTLIIKSPSSVVHVLSNPTYFNSEIGMVKKICFSSCDFINIFLKARNR